MKTGRADCGMQYGVRRAGSAVAYCSLSVKCGTRDEGEFHSGIAHFTEHTIFKGTERKSATVVNSYLEKLGGELNAYTTKEEIVLHATVLKEDLPKAVGLLLEIASQSTFPDKEIETEKGVVIDEIAQYKDSPADDVYDKFEEMYFEGHPLGRSILGTSGSVRKISADELRRFRAEKFVPAKMALAIVSDLPDARAEALVLKLVAKYFPLPEPVEGKPVEGNGVSTSSTAVALPEPSTVPEPVEGPTVNVFDVTLDKHNHEANAVIGAEAPTLYEEHERLTAVLLANILGGPSSNSMLSAVLRERHGWVYGVECSYTQYSDSGMMAISLGCDKENLPRCLEEVDKILETVRTKPLSEARLKAAKRQMLGQLAIASDNGETQCLSMGKSLLAFGRIASDSESRAAIASITSEEVRAMACRIFTKEKISRLIYL